MKSKSVTAMTLAAVIFVSACAGRAPNPVATVQPIDETTNCEAIQAEVNSNTQRIAELGSEQSAKVAQNVVMGIAGLFLILPWFLMDFQNAAGKEEAALKSRNDHLASLARQRCGQPEPTRRAR
ncbi:MAG: hypothetical protein ACKPAC_19245 [Alphaproteobacteria bacterium]